MTKRLKVKFLVVIWGARYVEEFAQISLPSYLAEGNLPHLAAVADLEVLIMTSRESRILFDQQAVFAKLNSYCSVRYIFIDDLISMGVYGVTLTLGYARGIRESGPDHTDTYFMFMNSDFVLSDGSLRALLARLRKGESCIMAPSLRVSSESVLPELLQAVDDGVLSMPSRQMVQIAFDNLHPTVIAKSVTQSLITCTTHNQIYWQVDRTTLLARYHLIFMLAIKPEVSMRAVNSYCDYGFVPELVPSGEFSILDDSDEFFMLELQSAAQEKHLLRGGYSTPGAIAAELSRWTTREHRRFAETDVIFRTGEIPDHLPEARRRFASYFALIRARMSATAVSHVDHYYWVMGVQAWASLKYESFEKLPPELGEQSTLGLSATITKRSKIKEVSARFERWYLGGLGSMRMRAGQRPNVPIWHHLWLDCRLLLNWKEMVTSRPGQKNLFICDEGNPLAPYFGALPGFDVETIEAVLPGTDGADRPVEVVDEQHYDSILLHVYRENMRKVKPTIHLMERRIKDGGTLAMFVEHLHGEIDPSNFSFELAQYVHEMLPLRWIGYQISVRYVGGRLKRWLRRLERQLIGFLWPSSVWRIPHLVAAITLWPIVAALTAANNFLQRNASMKCPPYCSSFLLSLRRIHGPMHAASLSRRS